VKQRGSRRAVAARCRRRAVTSASRMKLQRVSEAPRCGLRRACDAAAFTHSPALLLRFGSDDGSGSPQHAVWSAAGRTARCASAGPTAAGGVRGGTYLKSFFRFFWLLLLPLLVAALATAFALEIAAFFRESFPFIVCGRACLGGRNTCSAVRGLRRFFAGGDPHQTPPTITSGRRVPAARHRMWWADRRQRTVLYGSGTACNDVQWALGPALGPVAIGGVGSVGQERATATRYLKLIGFYYVYCPLCDLRFSLTPCAGTHLAASPPEGASCVNYVLSALITTTRHLQRKRTLRKR
jgi:hypothetical protein